jgi:hypothetical protein
LAVLTVVSTTVTKNDITAAHGNLAAVTPALVHGFQRGFMVASLFAITGSIVVALVVKSVRPTKTDLDRELETEAEALPAIPGA